MSSNLTTPELFAHAWRLCAPDLVWTRPGEAPDERERIAELLVREEPGVERGVADRAVDAVLRRSPRWEDSIDALAGALLRMQDGEVALRDHPEATSIASIVSLGPLNVWFQRARLAGISDVEARAHALAWPTRPADERTPWEDVLRRPMAELHVHLSGVLEPSTVWLLVLSDLVTIEDALSSDRRSGDEIGRWRSAIQAAKHWWRHKSRGPLALGEALLQLDQPREGAALGWARWPEEREAWEYLEQAQEEGLALLRVQVGPKENPREVLLSRLLERDRLAVAFSRLAGGSLTPEEEAHLFRYLSARNAFHHRLVMRPGTRGLKRFFRAMSERHAWSMAGGTWASQTAHGLRRLQAFEAVSSYLDDATSTCAASDGGALPNLDIELRVSLELSARDNLRAYLLSWVRGALIALRSQPRAPVAVVFVYHFIKGRGPERGAEMMEQARALLDLLQAEPSLRRIVAGVDVAGDELACPPRTWAPVLKWIRERSDELAFPHPEPALRLGRTGHAGEDFLDLLTGVRHCADLVVLADLRERDRIGHGLALTWDPERFYPQRSLVFTDVATHLLDLAWAYRLMLTGEIDSASALWIGHRLDSGLDGLVRLSSEWRTRCRELWSGGRPGSTVVRAATADEGSSDPSRCSYEDDRRQREDLSEEATIARVFRLPLEEVHELRSRDVEIPGHDQTWLRIVATVQSRVVEEVIARGLVIEENPTSNRNIGGFRRHRELPYLPRLDRPTDDPRRRLRLTFNTDDPGLFQTTLRSEYRRVARAMDALGYDVPTIETFLEQARSRAVTASFVTRATPRGHAQLRAWFEEATGKLKTEDPEGSSGSDRRP